MSRSRLTLVTLGIMLSLFLASMESTVIATAMPTIVSKLGGLAIYSWAFAAYMIASTVATPIYGKLSDVFGRKGVYVTAMLVFLAGSTLCGMANSMELLIAARAVQGVGGGGLLALAFIIVGDVFSLQQRARMQGVFSGVWGLSSIVGPLLGGFLVDQVSWPWVFFVNLGPGALCVLVVMFSLRDRPRLTKRPQIDFAGAALLTVATTCLLLGLQQATTLAGLGEIAAGVVALGLLIVVERRAPDPILPITLFRSRLFASANGQGFFSGWAMFGSLSFVPLLVQAVFGTTATQAGTTLTPMMLGWVLASVASSRLLLRVKYRSLAVLGMSALVVGSVLLTVAGTSQPAVMVFTGMMGIGMGLSIPSFLIAVQSTVPRAALGTATSTLQFTRSIGGALGVNVMGAMLSSRLATLTSAAGLTAANSSLDSLLDPAVRGSEPLNQALQAALGGALQSVFLIGVVAAAVGLAVTALAPHDRLGQSDSVPSESAIPVEP